MDELNTPLDIEGLSTEEFAARSILRRFPDATLETRERPSGAVYKIFFQQKHLLRIDKWGARYHFPSRRKRSLQWRKIKKSGLPRTIDYILRDLAEADYEVLSSSNRPIPKRPIHLSRYTMCPICKVRGGVKIIYRGESLPEENSELYTAISRSIELNGAEIKCTLCEWIGIREELTRKARRPPQVRD